MSDFLLELLSEEIPARMQAKAQQDLARLFSDQLSTAGLRAEAIETYATPRRLALIARGLPDATEPVREETRGPRASAPPQALEGFLRKTGLAREQLVERDGTLFAIAEKPGRATSAVLAEAVPAVVRAFPWPKSMRWGAPSIATDSPRWVRPLHGIVALFGEEIVKMEVAGVTSGAATLGHRFHHPGIITIGSANDYAEKLRACHVVLDPDERTASIRERAQALAAAAGLALIEDEGLLAENAGLTEWPVPLLGRFDPAFLDVPREVIQLTMRTNQKYFALTPLPEGEREMPRSGEGEGMGSSAAGPHPGAARLSLSPAGRGELAPNFVCTANIEAADGGAAIVAGNERVLSARLADAKFFWEQDLRVPLEQQADKLGGIVFHEKLGTLADKAERVAKLAKWLVEQGIITPSPSRGEGQVREANQGEGPSYVKGAGSPSPSAADAAFPASGEDSPRLSSARPGDGRPDAPLQGEGIDLAAFAERAARLCKADLVTSMVGEFPELQGVIGGHLARAQGEPDAIADAVRDHYKPVGQGDEVPTAPVTVAVSLADKLDTVVGFFALGLPPTGSKDPFALRRAALGVVATVLWSDLRCRLNHVMNGIYGIYIDQAQEAVVRATQERKGAAFRERVAELRSKLTAGMLPNREAFAKELAKAHFSAEHRGLLERALLIGDAGIANRTIVDVRAFLIDRLKVQQREAGVRHDLIDAVFALGGEDDLVRLLARVKALQAFVETREGADLLAGYKRAANILRKEGYSPSPSRGEGQRTPAKAGGTQGEGTAGPSPSAAGAAFPASGEDSPR
ncbi:MAG TPA: glycine--tRNA ligase subunit beta, partial [Allosphingosinicella sp.]|nr:glycine--tRNA ligase subunit beta [Allosphingosinicella sp.]